MKDFRAIVAKFQIEDVFIEARPLGHGAINDTYEIICENDHYVLQEINRMVFKHPADVMNNLFAVTEHLKKKIEEEGGDPKRETSVQKKEIRCTRRQRKAITVCTA